MTHFVRVKKKKFIKLLPNITPYIRAGVHIWAMFHGRGTRRIIRDNWVQWIGQLSYSALAVGLINFFHLCFFAAKPQKKQV